MLLQNMQFPQRAQTAGSTHLRTGWERLLRNGAARRGRERFIRLLTVRWPLPPVRMKCTGSAASRPDVGPRVSVDATHCDGGATGFFPLLRNSARLSALSS